MKIGLDTWILNRIPCCSEFVCVHSPFIRTSAEYFVKPRVEHAGLGDLLQRLQGLLGVGGEAEEELEADVTVKARQNRFVLDEGGVDGLGDGIEVVEPVEDGQEYPQEARGHVAVGEGLLEEEGEGRFVRRLFD